MAAADTSTQQQHPIRLYLVVWLWLFVLSFFSYLVEYYDVQGAWRWILVLSFMMVKAGLIVAIFMHMVWERLALVYAVLVPPLVLFVLVVIMQLESLYTAYVRDLFFATGAV